MLVKSISQTHTRQSGRYMHRRFEYEWQAANAAIALSV